MSLTSLTVRRAFWASASPVVWLLHRARLCSYKWVNVCHGARRPDRFDPLWQHRWYGARIPSLPDAVVLCGIGYRTAVAEGTVTFRCEDFGGRITFERDPYVTPGILWGVELSQPLPAPHVRQAYEWVCAVFGDSFDVRRPAGTDGADQETT